MHNTWPGGLNLPAGARARRRRRTARCRSGRIGLPSSILARAPVPAQGDRHRGQSAHRQRQLEEGAGGVQGAGVLRLHRPLHGRGGLLCRRDSARRQRLRDGRRLHAARRPLASAGSTPPCRAWANARPTSKSGSTSPPRMAKHDTKNPPEYWTGNLRAEWKDYGKLWAEFVARTPGVGGMTQARMEKRAEPLRWPCPSEKSPGHQHALSRSPIVVRRGRSARPEEQGQALPHRRAARWKSSRRSSMRSSPRAGHSALPIFYTHPEVTGAKPEHRIRARSSCRIRSIPAASRRT